jgi:hypothetical protein
VIYRFVIPCFCLALSAGGLELPTSIQIADVEERVADLRPSGDDWGTDEPYLTLRIQPGGLEKYRHENAEDLLLFRDPEMDDICVPKTHHGSVWKTYSFRASNNFESYNKIKFERDGELGFLLKKFRHKYPESKGYRVSVLFHYEFGRFLVIHNNLTTFYLVPLTRRGRELFADTDKEMQKIWEQYKNGASWYEIDFRTYEISKVADRIYEAANSQLSN